MLVPQWLERLLNTTFFAVCRSHGGTSGRSECNMYCLDCNSGAFCLYCRSSRHRDHQVIQIRRSSYHDVVKVSEIEKVLDISGVQTYVINSARVLFLNERPLHHKSSGKSVSHICQICGRSLLDTFHFCSLGCKLIGIKRNGEASFSLDSKNGLTLQRGQNISRRVNKMSSSREEEEEELGEDISPNTPPPPPTARRRKGIPQRAPFRS